MAYGRDSKDKIEYYITKNRVKTYHLGSVFCYSDVGVVCMNNV